MKNKFTEIFNRNGWGCDESVSGPSSTLARTTNLRHSLPLLLEKYKIEVFFDAPCGDFNWMKKIIKNLEVHYIGADIVSEIVKNNTKQYGSDTVRFLELDLTTDAFPTADMMLCRDMLFHFSYLDTKRFFERFFDSNIPLLLTTSHNNPKGFKNKDIATGGWRYMDLRIDPYNIKVGPLETIRDGNDRVLYLWDRVSLINSMQKFM